jgi:hypothetical protein
MNDQESRIARRVTACLDQGAAGLRAGTVYRLQQARAAALAGVEQAHATERALAPAGNVASAGRAGVRGGPARWLGAVVLVAALGFGFQQWRAVQQVQEFEELDLRLLASDLPIDAYLDR